MTQVQELLTFMKPKDLLQRKKTPQENQIQTKPLETLSTLNLDEHVQSSVESLQRQRKVVKMPAREMSEAGWIRNTLQEAKRKNEFN